MKNFQTLLQIDGYIEAELDEEVYVSIVRELKDNTSIVTVVETDGEEVEHSSTTINDVVEFLKSRLSPKQLEELDDYVLEMLTDFNDGETTDEMYDGCLTPGGHNVQ